MSESAIRLTLPEIQTKLLIGRTRQTNVVVKCGDLSYKIFALNKRIRLTSLHLGKLRWVAPVNILTRFKLIYNSLETIIKL